MWVMWGPSQVQSCPWGVLRSSSRLHCRPTSPLPKSASSSFPWALPNRLLRNQSLSYHLLPSDPNLWELVQDCLRNRPQDRIWELDAPAPTTQMAVPERSPSLVVDRAQIVPAMGAQQLLKLSQETSWSGIAEKENALESKIWQAFEMMGGIVPKVMCLLLSVTDAFGERW